MAYEEHVKIVRNGEAAIALFRKKHPDVILDVSGADLSGTDLRNADLRQARLSSAKLIGANLMKADLADAELYNANLSGADLRNANLFAATLYQADLREARLYWTQLVLAQLCKSNLGGTDLSNANLSGADLSEANLYWTNLSEANLSNADFTGAHLSGTLFTAVDLSTTKGLHKVIYRGPCAIGIDTLYRSQGKIPDVFLRGCGVPDDLITYLPSLLGKVLDFYSCFISHSSRDAEFAQRLHSRMQQERLRVWYAPEDMKGGRKSCRQIDEAIRVHDKLLLVLSKHSMESEWVKSEIRWARKAEQQDGRQRLFPVRLASMKAIKEWECFDSDSGKDLAVEVREYHIPDFSNWKEHDAFEASFKKLLNDLRKSEETPSGAGSAQS